VVYLCGCFSLYLITLEGNKMVTMKGGDEMEI
jgi:hypothetical protein